MKYFILFFTLLTLNCAAQKYDYTDGYRFLKDAEKHFKNGKLDKAQRNLNEAKKCSWGFCGNAWASAQSEIHILEYKVLCLQGDYITALSTLDSIKGCKFGANCYTRDSLKIQALILIHGKDSVQSQFTKILHKSLKLDNSYDPFNQSIFLADLDYTFVFFKSPYINKEDDLASSTFEDLAKHLPFYKLLDL